MHTTNNQQIVSGGIKSSRCYTESAICTLLSMLFLMKQVSVLPFFLRRQQKYLDAYTKSIKKSFGRTFHTILVELTFQAHFDLQLSR